MYMASGDAGLKDPALRLNLNRPAFPIQGIGTRTARKGGRYERHTEERFFGRKDRGLRMTARTCVEGEDAALERGGTSKPKFKTGPP